MVVVHVVQVLMATGLAQEALPVALVYLLLFPELLILVPTMIIVRQKYYHQKYLRFLYNIYVLLQNALPFIAMKRNGKSKAKNEYEG